MSKNSQLKSILFKTYKRSSDAFVLSSFILELLYLMTETQYGVNKFVILRGFCRLRFRLKVTSNVFRFIFLGK